MTKPIEDKDVSHSTLVPGPLYAGFLMPGGTFASTQHIFKGPNV